MLLLLLLLLQKKKNNNKSPLKEIKTRNRKEQGEPKWPELLLKVAEMSQDDNRGEVKISDFRRQEERGESEETKDHFRKLNKEKVQPDHTLKYP